MSATAHRYPIDQTQLKTLTGFIGQPARLAGIIAQNTGFKPDQALAVREALGIVNNLFFWGRSTVSRHYFPHPCTPAGSRPFNVVGIVIEAVVCLRPQRRRQAALHIGLRSADGQANIVMGRNYYTIGEMLEVFDGGKIPDELYIL